MLQGDVAVAISSGAFILYEAFAKSTSTLDLKDRLAACRARLLTTTVLEIETILRPYWPQSASRIILESGFVQETATVLSEDAKDALRDCLEDSGSLRHAAKMRGMATKISRWDRVCYWVTFATAISSIIGLGMRLFWEGMSDYVAVRAVVIPTSLAVFALFTAAIRQIHVHRANDAIVKENE